ncbi:polysaccharide deacetylase family protein [Shewanella polaris]|uniref:Polysaccharide deacetylase n=1 Tax=Shewanella polaris TaxID=2588449 RepID=A0A4Y5YHT7_9GAMM|nr:polysaccharide deacetylase family protein [Shewanella polaris]QDE32371.1 polysaccharide deacetylase [Shewanella polaris]
MIQISLFFLVLLFSFSSYSQTPSKEFTWPGGRTLAISLSYDDALNSQLDHVIPELNKHHFKASFYVVANSPVLNVRMEEWRAVANAGHELGNHSVYHPCRGSRADRDWVEMHHDLDHYSVIQMIEELAVANILLKAIDGKTERTYTVPCGDLLVGSNLPVGGKKYLNDIEHLFTAIKGQGDDKRFSPILYPEGQNGEQLIEYVQKLSSDILLINIIFHGVGGDYLSVSSEAHAELLTFLADNRELYYVDSYINLMRYANSIL